MRKQKINQIFSVLSENRLRVDNGLSFRSLNSYVV